ncbi:MAG: hypothetical protein QGD96_02915 [Anaerolineae bacterium]|nr:hypothetical protein [Anaerolineae bacterium]
MNLQRLLIPRLEYIFLAAVFWGIAASGPSILNFDGDLPRHLLVGQQTIQSLNVSTIDIFSFRTEGLPSYPHEWLAQVFLTFGYIIFELNGVILVVSILITLTFAVVYKNVRTAASPLIALIFTGLALSASTIHILPRPHIFTYLMVAIWIFLLEKVRLKQSRAWWIFPIVMLIWVNLHGMFILGILIWLAYIVGKIYDHKFKTKAALTNNWPLFVGGLISIPVTFLSPSGPGIWKVIFELGSNTYITSRISEYQTANFLLPGTWPFILMIVLMVLGLVLNPKKIPASHFLMLLGFSILAFYSSRMIPIFAIVTAPIVARLTTNWINHKKQGSKFLQLESFLRSMEANFSGIIWVWVTALAVTLLLAFGFTIDPQNKGNTFDENVFPVTAVNWLKDHPQTGHMLNDFNWGGYILLETWPKYEIFMDGHTHIYGETLTREYEQVITTSDSWESTLNKYKIEWAILPSSSQLVNALTGKGWETLYIDENAIILRAN